jgi:hypothetical protein
MINLPGILLSEFPYKELNKVSDLLYYDGTLLSHFKDNYDHNFLFIWEDSDSESNRWLIVELTEYELFQYIKGKINLNDLVVKTKSKFHYFVDITTKLEYINTQIIEPRNIPEEYIPDKDSFYSVKPPEDLYKDLLKKYEDSYYIDNLKTKAYYFKVEPTEKTFANTVGIDTVIEVLNNIKQSFSSYNDIQFHRAFDNKYSADNVRMMYSKVSKLTVPRIVDAKCASFSAGIMVDNVSSVGDIPEINKWKNNVFIDFKSEVLEVDYNSDEVVDKIINEFNWEERKKVFEPILNVFSNKDYTLFSTDKTLNIINKPNPTKRNIDKIVKPIGIEELPVEKAKALMQYIVEVEKTPDGTTKLSSSLLKQHTLFSEELKEFPQKLNVIQFDNKSVNLKIPINYTIKLLKDKYILNQAETKIELQADDVDSVRKAFIEQINDVSTNLMYKDKDLNPEEIEIKKFIQSLL